jgi:DeoR/GlpR family transcriptional regulator of sugar metabolism
VSSRDVSQEPGRTTTALNQDPPGSSGQTASKLAENMITSFGVGFASALPAAILVLLKKADWVVIISIIITCIAVGVASYASITGRRRAKATRQLAAPVHNRSVSTQVQPVSDEHDRLRQALSGIVFTILWNRAKPEMPLNPLVLSRIVAERAPELVGERSPEDIVRAIEEIRVLHVLPTLERARSGFFLRSDDFHLNKTTAPDAKKQVAFAAASYVHPGMSIAFDGGSTTLEVARVLIGRIVARTLHSIRITTSSIQICTEFLAVHECREAIRLGELEVWSMAGPLHPSCWTQDPPNTETCPWPLELAIIGANGITRDGFYLPNNDGLEVKKTFLAVAPSTLIVADSTKIGRELPVLFATWDDRVTLITDRPSDAAARHLMQSFPKRKIVYSSDVPQGHEVEM